ncbi:hypothetical protein EB118_03875 [bacterium]|nr:hypothetical protein [bacterium]NBX97247.1 hypothetical protein [bacterium]NDC94490.1 hypothetical protein [bacterium]NDD84477.1 hypothetical protein [bacterium]NDG29224.1 hypothetical protein [bacterium]
MAKKQSTNNKNMFKIFTNALLLSGVFVGLLLLQSAVWAGRAFFDTKTFSNTVTNSLTSQSSRDAIAAELVNKAFEDRPIARRVIGPKLTSGVSSLLDSSIAENSIRTISDRMQSYLSASDQNQKTVAIDVTGLKTVIQTVSSLVDTSNGQTINSDKLPDTITIIDAEKVPSFYKYGKILYYLSPLSALLVIGCAFGYIKRSKNGYRRLYVVCATVAASTLTAIAMGPLFKPSVLEFAKSTSTRTVVANLYDAFLHLFTRQLFIALVLSIIIALALFIVQNQRKIVAVFTKK